MQNGCYVYKLVYLGKKFYAKKETAFLPFLQDGLSGTRTLDQLIKSQLLYQLS
ncbi:hypothetical protein PRIO_2393 [Paenibacillus riograndensis SBR5]|uniref:Uncharacterized protein n=1 Tax=Paenibacillus riograndensis SBR5 TaxID=1073571 RepID=A0A0E4CW15_9BACL|nr:hypothetical protein PRIO_2393 [Paenibacillus riograndensis SBR5]